MRFPKLVAFVGIVIVSTLLLAACGSDPTATPVPTPTATAPPADEPTPTPDPFLAEWAELVAAAQEEGEVVTFICCGVGRSVSERIPEFEAEFGIKWTNSTGSSFQQSPKILAEREAGKYTLDV
jgi:ABC-type glycerol-3-phosphate transport system substrate-binding protein